MKKVFFVIQGHTQYVDNLIENYKNVDNVIWSTDSDSNSSDLEKIKNSNITLVLNDKPSSGYGNINLQLKSTMSGIIKAEEMGATHVIKTRSDLIFKDPNKFLNEYDFDNKLHFLAYIQHGPWADTNITGIYPEIPNWIKDNNYSDLIGDICDYNYIADFSNLGPIDEMKIFWGYPLEETPIRIPAEFKLVLNYFNIKKYKKINFDLNSLKEIFGFYISFCKKTDNPMISLKRGWTTNELFDGPRGDGSWSGWKG
jgi:hypothetical protein